MKMNQSTSSLKRCVDLRLLLLLALGSATVVRYWLLFETLQTLTKIGGRCVYIPYSDWCVSPAGSLLPRRSGLVKKMDGTLV